MTGPAVVKLESRIEVKNGREYTVYKKTIFKSNHPQYAEELKKKIDFEENLKKQPIQVFPNASPSSR